MTSRRTPRLILGLLLVLTCLVGATINASTSAAASVTTTSVTDSTSRYNANANHLSAAADMNRNVGGSATPHDEWSAGASVPHPLPAPDFVAAESGGGILANQAAGNAARDAIAARYAGSSTEVGFETSLGARRVDVLTQDGLAIESKVGRTSLTGDIQTQIAKDQLLVRGGQVNGVQWQFTRSAVTGQIGPTGPLGAALDKAGIPWTLGP